MATPRLPYFEWNVCPGEGCIYGAWTARNVVTVYSSWKRSRHRLSRLDPGDKVTGLTGVIITFKPGEIRADRDDPRFGLKRGDAILTYGYSNEGFASAWFKGRYFPDFDISFATRPDGTGCSGDRCSGRQVALGETVWWAEVKLRSGRLGWVDMQDADFNGTCALFSPK